MAVAIPWISLALTAVGTGVAVKGSLDAAAASEKAGEFNEAVAKNQAQAESDKAAYEAQRIRKRNLVLLGKQRAAYAKSGVNLSGSALDVMFDSSMEGELDALAAQYTGATAAGFYRSKGQLARMEGDNAAAASRYHAYGTLLTGAGRISQRVYDSRQNNPTFED